MTRDLLKSWSNKSRGCFKVSGSLAFATSSMIQAARLAPALRRASGLSRSLLPPPLSLRPVASGRAGRTACARRIGRGRRRASSPPSPPAVAVVPSLRVAALRHVGARRECPGPPLRPAGCRARLNRRTNAAVAYAWCRAAGRRSRSPACAGSACGSAPFASAPVASARSARPGARGARALALTCSGVALRAVTLRPEPGGRLHGRRRFAPALGLPLTRRRPLRRAALLSPRLELRALAVAAPRVARCPTPRVVGSAALRRRREPPLALLASCAA